MAITPPRGTRKTPPGGLRDAFTSAWKTTTGFIVPDNLRVQGYERNILNSQKATAIISDAAELLIIEEKGQRGASQNLERPSALRKSIARAHHAVINNIYDPIERIEVALDAIATAQTAKELDFYPSPQQVLAGVKPKLLAEGIEEDFDHGRDRPLSREQLNKLVSALSPKKAYHVLRNTEAMARSSIVASLSLEQLLELHEEYEGYKLEPFLGPDSMYVCDKLCGSMPVDAEYVGDRDYAGLLTIAARHNPFNANGVFRRIIAQDPQNLTRLIRNLPADTIGILLSDPSTASQIASLGDNVVANCLKSMDLDQIMRVYSALHSNPQLLNLLLARPNSIACIAAKAQNYFFIHHQPHTALVLFILQTTQQQYPQLHQALLRFIQGADDQSIWEVLSSLSNMHYEWAAYVFSSLNTQRAIKLALENIPLKELSQWVHRMIFEIGKWNDVMAKAFSAMLLEAARLSAKPPAPRAERLDQLPDQQIAEHLITRADSDATRALNQLHPMRAGKVVTIIRMLTRQQNPSWEERCYSSLSGDVHMAMQKLLEIEKEKHFKQQNQGMSKEEVAAKKLADLGEGFEIGMNADEARSAFRTAMKKYHYDMNNAKTVAGEMNIQTLKAKEERGQMITDLYNEAKGFYKAS
ncbi:MAG: hypothetical protein HQ564_10665 [Candidatus Saganbacteria bacterium]|nr:hypothetical protein [Candidatus Saganbacteria bacterium]